MIDGGTQSLQPVQDRRIVRLRARSCRMIDETEIRTREWTNRLTGETRSVPVGIDPGWDYNPGAAHVRRARAGVNTAEGPIAYRAPQVTDTDEPFCSKIRLELEKALRSPGLGSRFPGGAFARLA